MISIHTHTHSLRETRYKSLKKTIQDGGRGKFSLFSLVVLMRSKSPKTWDGKRGKFPHSSLRESARECERESVRETLHPSTETLPQCMSCTHHLTPSTHKPSTPGDRPTRRSRSQPNAATNIFKPSLALTLPLALTSPPHILPRILRGQEGWFPYNYCEKI